MSQVGHDRVRIAHRERRIRRGAVVLLVALLTASLASGCTAAVHRRWLGEGYPSHLRLRLDRATLDEVAIDAALLRDEETIRPFALSFAPELRDPDRCGAPRVAVVGGVTLLPGEVVERPIETDGLRAKVVEVSDCEVALDFTPLEGRGGVVFEAISQSGPVHETELRAPRQHEWLLAYPAAVVSDIVVGAGIAVVVIPYGLCRAVGRRCIEWLDGVAFSP